MRPYFFVRVTRLFFLIPLTVTIFGSPFAVAGNTSDIKAFSTDHRAILASLMETHREIKSYRHRVESARDKLRQSIGLYLPSVDLLGDAGHEEIQKEFFDDTNAWRHEIRLRGTQLVTDFGKTTTLISRDRVALAQAEAQLESMVQQTLTQGVTAYIQVVRARERLKSARSSEERIKELTGVEKALVEKGAGLTSDVLQAKSQLAGAMVLRVAAEGELKLAKNHFQALFYHYPTDEEVQAFVDIPLPSAHIPDALEPAMASALDHHPEIRITHLDLNLSQKDVDLSKSGYFPTMNLFGEVVHANDDNGLKGYRKDYAVGMAFNYNLFRGGSDYAAVQSAQENRAAAATHLEHAKQLVQEQVRDSWEQFLTLSRQKEMLDQQTEILKHFLTLAKKERTMGTRSLLDVLTGEVNYINARGTAIAAGEDLKIAAFNLLFSMGQMNLNLFPTVQ